MNNLEALNKTTITEYLSIAKKLILSIGPTMRSGLAKEMLASEDARCDIAYAIMIADSKYNGMGTREGYRKERAKFAIKKYLTNQKKNKAQEKELKHLFKITKKFENDTIEDVMQADLFEFVKKNIEKLPHPLAYCIKSKYFDYQTLDEIGKHLKCTKENVRLCIIKGIKILKETCHA